MGLKMSKIKAKNLKKKETARDKRFVQTNIRLDPYHRNTSRIKCGPDGSVMETISTSNLYNYCSRDGAYWIEARILNSSKQQLLTLHFLLFSSSLKKRKRNRPLLTCGSWASCSLQSCILICFMPFMPTLDPLLWGAKQEIVLEEKSIYIGA